MRHRRNALAVAAVLLLTAFFRFYLITEVPPGLYPDEAANGNNAVEALRTGGFKIFYPENNGREGLFINLQAMAIKLFGAEPWTLRLVSAIFGTLTVLGIYLLTRELLRESRIQNLESRSAITIALLAAFFLATSFWHINFSRIGFRAVLVPFFSTFALYWLLKALRTGKISSAVAGGIMTGLGLHTYIAFRFLPFVLAVPITFALAAWRRERVANGAAGRKLPCIPCVIVLFLFVTFIAALPIGLYFLQQPADFFGRGGQVSIFSVDAPLWEFIKSNILTLGMFNIWGDCNGRHNLSCQPELFWPVGILFVIGTGLTIQELWRRPLAENLAAATLIAWFVFLMFPATLTREGLPHALRSIGMIPPVMILAAIGGAALWQYLAPRVSGPGSRVLSIGAILFLIWIPVNAYRDYFVRFASSPATADAFANDLWEQGRYLAKLPEDVQKFVIVNLSGEDIRGAPAPAQTIMFATNTFDEARRRAKNLTYITRPEDIAIDAEARVVIIPMNPKDEALASALGQKFPGLRTQTLGGVTIFRN